MKKNPLAVLTILTALVLSVTIQSHAATQTLNGIISDSMCAKKHMMPGKSDAECIKECVKAGSKYVLVVGDKTYTLNGKVPMIAALAGKHVQVKGDVNQDTINVSEIHEARGASHPGMTM